MNLPTYRPSYKDVAIVFLLAVFFVRECDHRSQILSFKDSMSFFTDSVRTYVRDNVTHVEQTVHSLSKEQLKELVKQDKRFTELEKQVGNIKNITNHQQYSFYYKDTVDLTLQADSSFQYKDKWASFIGKVKDDTLNLQYSMTDSLAITSYWKRDKLFSPKYLVLDASFSNPNFKLRNATNFTVRPNRKWYQSTGFKVTAGVVTGVLLYGTLNRR